MERTTTSAAASYDVAYHKEKENKQVKVLSHKDIEEMLAEKHGERFRQYRREWQMGMRLEDYADFPPSLDIENLNNCNFACDFCMFSIKDSHPDRRERRGLKMMPLDLYKRAIDEGAEHGLAAITHGVQCEPMMHPDIIEMLSYAERKGVMDQRLGTNGSYLNKEISEQLVDTGIARLEVSLDAASADTFKQVRKGKMAIYENIVRNIHEFLEVREKRGATFPLLRVSMVKTDVNRHEVDQFIDYWKEYVDYFSIQELLDYRIELDKENAGFEQQWMGRQFRCEKTFNRIFMRWNGTLQPCFMMPLPDFEEKMALAKFPETSIYDAWHSDAMNELRDIHRENRYREHSVCRACSRCTTAVDDEDALAGA